MPAEVTLSNLAHVNHVGTDMIKTLKRELDKVHDALILAKNTLGIYERQFQISATVTTPVETSHSTEMFSNVTNIEDYEHMEINDADAGL